MSYMNFIQGNIVMNIREEREIMKQYRLIKEEESTVPPEDVIKKAAKWLADCLRGNEDTLSTPEQINEFEQLLFQKMNKLKNFSIHFDYAPVTSFFYTILNKAEINYYDFTKFPKKTLMYTKGEKIYIQTSYPYKVYDLDEMIKKNEQNKIEFEKRHQEHSNDPDYVSRYDAFKKEAELDKIYMLDRYKKEQAGVEGLPKPLRIMIRDGKYFNEIKSLDFSSDPWGTMFKALLKKYKKVDNAVGTVARYVKEDVISMLDAFNMLKDNDEAFKISQIQYHFLDYIEDVTNALNNEKDSKNTDYMNWLLGINIDTYHVTKEQLINYINALKKATAQKPNEMINKRIVGLEIELKYKT